MKNRGEIVVERGWPETHFPLLVFSREPHKDLGALTLEFISNPCLHRGNLTIIVTMVIIVIDGRYANFIT